MDHMNIAVYPTGGPSPGELHLRDLPRLLAGGEAVGWVSVADPHPQQVREIAETFDLPALAVSDVLKGGQRSKIEEYGDIRFLVLRSADTRGDLLGTYVFLGPSFVVCLTYGGGAPDLDHRVAAGEPFHNSAEGIAYLVLDEVVDTYEPVVERIGEEIDDAEEEVFAGNSGIAQRLHEQLRGVLRYQRATHALVSIAEHLLGSAPEELRSHFRDIHDHTLRASARIDSYREILSSAMQVHIALVGQEQNQEMARISRAAFEQGEQSKRVASWAAILFTPTVIAGIYGMNFHHMPELASRYGYPLALVGMCTAAVGLYAIFKRQGWL